MLSRVVPVILGHMDARRDRFGVASVISVELSPDQADMHVFISCEREQKEACGWARGCVRDVLGELKKSGLLRRLPYVSFKPAPVDRGPALSALIDQASAQLRRAEAAAKPEAKPVPAAKKPATKKAAPAAKKVSPKAPAKKAAPKKPAAKKVAPKAAAKPAKKATPRKK